MHNIESLTRAIRTVRKRSGECEFFANSQWTHAANMPVFCIVTPSTSLPICTREEMHR